MEQASSLFSLLCAEGTLLFPADLGTCSHLEVVVLSLLPAWPGPRISICQEFYLFNDSLVSRLEDEGILESNF